MEHVNRKDHQFLNRKHTFVIVLTKKKGYAYIVTSYDSEKSSSVFLHTWQCFNRGNWSISGSHFVVIQIYADENSWVKFIVYSLLENS